MLIGYARVSTHTQNLDRQLAALGEAGCERIFKEKASGRDTRNRPKLEQALRLLKSGDVLVLAEWDRATRSMSDGLAIINRIARKGATIRVLDRAYLDLTSPVGKGLLAFLSALAEDERQRIVARAAQGRIAARRRGVRFGAPLKLSAEARAEILERLARGETYRAIASHYGVHASTIARLRGRK
ncbi:recombinase family protein [Rhodomicrobium sp. Az07]|uniref:recombinase family protein n=1 Tax=Rhodomicrobium sp. Az07 TaxID=2839034 RepID=UPI001BE89835|nr:recombinase family protein [Rhodomicrobium sp. Az07]MBT3071408.1 recombinase family protein [Rhodomicrobium sp. Az07]